MSWHELLCRRQAGEFCRFISHPLREQAKSGRASTYILRNLPEKRFLPTNIGPFTDHPPLLLLLSIEKLAIMDKKKSLVTRQILEIEKESKTI